jgi:hypothetical protein
MYIQTNGKWENKRSTNSSLEDSTYPNMCAIWDVIGRKRKRRARRRWVKDKNQSLNIQSFYRRRRRRHHTVSYLFFSFLFWDDESRSFMWRISSNDKIAIHRHIERHNKCINNIFLLFDAYGIALASQQDDERTASFSFHKIAWYNHCLFGSRMDKNDDIVQADLLRFDAFHSVICTYRRIEMNMTKKRK